MAQINATSGVVWDDTNKILYLSDETSHVVRAVDAKATPPTITTYAGGANISLAPWGDGNVATQATLDPGDLTIGPDGALYIADFYYANGIRRVDPSSKVISTFIAPSTGCSPTYQFDTCYGSDQNCHMAWDSSGNLYLAGLFCGGIGGSNGLFDGIGKRASNGSWTQILGAYGVPAGQTADGTLATAYSTGSFGGINGMAVDGSGQLHFFDGNLFKIERIDLTGHVYAVTGTGTQGYYGDGVPASMGQISRVYSMLFVGTHMLFPDYDNSTVREIY
jgi:hypothetical protein